MFICLSLYMPLSVSLSNLPSSPTLTPANRKTSSVFRGLPTSFTHSLNQSIKQSNNHSLIHSLIHSFIHPLFNRQTTLSFTHSLTRSHTHGHIHIITFRGA